MNTKQLTLALVIIAAATLVLAPSLSGTAFAKKVQVCPSGNPCSGNSGAHNPNAYCTTNGVNRPNCGNSQ